MTTQEIAFMINLIKSNHHRRINIFFINILAFILPILFTVLLVNTCEPSETNRYIFVGMACIAVVSAIRMLVYYTGSNPWDTKKEQVTALKNHEHLPFEDLSKCVTLDEYFLLK